MTSFLQNDEFLITDFDIESCFLSFYSNDFFDNSQNQIGFEIEDACLLYKNKQYESAFKKFQSIIGSEEERYPDVYFRIGVMYLCGKGTEKDVTAARNSFETARQLLEKKLKNGIELSRYENFSLGMMYLHGYGIPTDPRQAEAHLLLSADAGLDEAQYELGEIYYIGELGISKNLGASLIYIQLSANQGNLDALFALGFSYEKGLHGTLDLEKALGYYKVAADANHPTAVLRCGLLLAKKDPNQAIAYLKKAAVLYNPEAFYRLGTLCEAVAAKIAKNGETNETNKVLLGLITRRESGILLSKENRINELSKWIFIYFKIAADLGHPQAQYKVARLFRYGVGTAKNVQTAVKYYEDSSKQGHSKAQCEVGLIYARGFTKETAQKIAVNMDKAIEYLRLSAKQGDPKALFGLATIYARGTDSVEQNIGISFGYCLASAKRGYPKAIECLESGGYPFRKIHAKLTS